MQHAAQRVRQGFGDPQVDELTNQAVICGEVDHAVVLGAPGQHGLIAPRGTFHQHALHAAHHGSGDRGGVFADRLLEPVQALLLDLMGDVIRPRRRRRAGTRTIDEAVGLVEADRLDQLQGIAEIGFGFTGKPDDEIRGKAEIGAHGPQPAHPVAVLGGGVAALHERQDAVRPALHRQVQMAHQRRHLGVDPDQALAQFQGMRGRVADARDAVDRRQILDQQREVGRGAVVHQSPVGVDVLSEQGHLAYALGGQPGNLGEHVVEGAAHLLAASVGHHAEGAVLAAALHHRDEGARPLGARRRQGVEFFDLGEGDVDHRRAPGTGGLDQLRQPVQGLRPEHHVHVRRTTAQRLALLAGHATADANDQSRAGMLEMAPLAELREHLLLRLLADRTGVEQQHVGLLGCAGQGEAVGGGEQLGHACRVVLVHLTAESLDEKPARHAPAAAARNALRYYCRPRLSTAPAHWLRRSSLPMKRFSTWLRGRKGIG